MRYFIFTLLLVLLLSGCADSKHLPLLERGTVKMEVEPYGLFDQGIKQKCVEYEVSIGNVILSIILVKTLVVPVILVGWYLWEPSNIDVDCVGEHAVQSMLQLKN